MPTNDFKPFAVGGSATVVTQATYAAAATLLANGFQVGLADPLYLNKVWRQSSLMSSVIGELVMAQTGQNVVDDGTLATILLNLTNAIKAIALGAGSAQTAVTTTGGTTALTAAQAQVGFIVVTGALLSDATITVPAAYGKWEVINATTGNFSVLFSAVAGTGVNVSQGAADNVICDGTNVRFANTDSAYANTSISTTGGTTVLTPSQAANKFVTVTGVLVSNATLTFPAALREWTIINATSGAFTVTAIASGGTGVPILQGGADNVMCDGTNVRYEGSSAVTRAGGDSSKAIATTEFVSNSTQGLTPSFLLMAQGII